MRKFIVGIFAAALMTSGLVAASEVASTAAPYPPSVRTTTHIHASPAGAHHATVFVRVTKNKKVKGQPSGTVKFTFVRTTGKTKTYRFSRSYSGPQTYRSGWMKVGHYAVVVDFVPKSGSKWLPSSDATSVVLKKHRHHR